MTKPLSVLTIGSAMIDTIVQIAPDRIEQLTMTNADTTFLLVETGQKVEANSIEQHIGGGAVNVAVSMSRQGAEAHCLIKLGDDIQAQHVLKRLHDESVSTDFVVHTGDASTGASVLVSSHERNAAVFTARGANTLLTESDLPDEAFQRDLVYVSGLSNASADQYPLILKKARAAGAFVASNPGIRQLSSRGQLFFQNLQNIDLLSLNRSEAAQMVPGLIGRSCEPKGMIPTDVDDPQSLMLRGLEAGGFQMDFSAYVKAVTDAGVKVLLVTDGGRGAYAATAERIVHCSTLPVEVAGTVGAGDAFASTFAFLSARGEDLEVGLRGASFNSASVIESIDTQSGLLSTDAICERLADAPAQPSLSSWAL